MSFRLPLYTPYKWIVPSCNIFYLFLSFASFFGLYICLFPCLSFTSLVLAKLCEGRAYGYWFQLLLHTLFQYHFGCIEALNVY